ncbi:spore coat U domain-containing protein, partial [Acinetobacter baumannii]|uniref:spore coat protein U domain-containing protein n=1 Tax=Acinetobacter baumannii TaxID=470 RepID=UPI001CDCAFFE
CGAKLENNIRLMKNGSSTNYLSYKLYNSSNLSNEYIVGNKYLLPATTPTNRLANFEIYGVVDLENNNEPHAAGIYKDTVSIMITW